MNYLWHWLLLAGVLWVTFRLYVWFLLEKRKDPARRSKKQQGRLVLLGGLFGIFLLISSTLALLTLMELGQLLIG